LLEPDNKKPEIQYPCSWEYKIIGSDVDKILSAIENAAGGMDYTITPSNVSRNNKYFSISAVVEVPNQVTRDIIYAALVKSEDIKFVL
jgi:putative lipoic acid-binding regulatory protein